MTRVRVDITRDTAEGSRVHIKGLQLGWTPTRRRVEVGEDGPELVLPLGFRHDASSVVVVDVPPSGPGWCWQVREMGPSSRIRHVMVPDVPGPIAYTALIDVDPATLDPVAEPEAAWWGALVDYSDVTTAARDEAVAAAQTATQDAAQAVNETFPPLVDQWLTANPPDDGREVELQTTATHVQWRYVGDATWLDLVPLSVISGDDGLSAELRTTATHIQWRQAGGAWADLIPLASLVGPAGPANTLTIGTVTTLAAGAPATAEITGTAPSQTLELGIPQGAAGAGGGVTTALYLPGASGNYVSTPHSAGQEILGDLDIRVQLALDNWDPALSALVAKAGTSGQYCWDLALSSSGIRLRWSPDGNRLSQMFMLPKLVPSFAPGEIGWLRVTLDADNGAGSSVLTVYESSDGIAWTQTGTRTYSGTASIFPGTSAITIGSRGTSDLAAGLFCYAEVRDGIDGPVVASWDGRAPATSSRDPQGNIWTVNGTANAWTVI